LKAKQPLLFLISKRPIFISIGVGHNLAISVNKGLNLDDNNLFEYRLKKYIEK